MTTYEFLDSFFQVKKEWKQAEITNQTAAYDVAQLVSGNIIYPLYGALRQNGFDMESITDHLESMYDSGNHFGFVYFVFILANAVDLIIPRQFSEMSANDVLVPILSAAIIEDWLEYDTTHEVSEGE